MAAVLAGVIVLELLGFTAGWLIGLADLRESPDAVAAPREQTSVSRRAPAVFPSASAPAAMTPLAFAVFPSMPELTRLTRSFARPFARPFRTVSRDVREYERLIREAAFRHALPPQLVLAVTRVESDFEPYELSSKGARGLMQVMPGTGARFGVRPDELFDPERNVAAGTAYLAWLHDRYRGDLDLTLAAYNAGEGAVDKYGGIPPYRETKEYVRRVRAALQEHPR